MELLELLHIMDFLRSAQQIETISRVSLEKAKKGVFAVVTAYLKSVDNPPVSEVMVLFCKLSSLFYPDLNTLSFYFLRQLEEASIEKGVLPFQVYE
jgi:hypothetical protein